MSMPIKWVRKALQNLAQAYEYIAADDPDAAVQVVIKIQAAAEKLATFPVLGKVGRVEGTRELVIASTPYIPAHLYFGVSGERQDSGNLAGAS
jgi:toxin ParE1/3/4